VFPKGGFVLIRRVFLLFLLAAMCPTSAFAQYEGDAAGRALFEQGEKALRSDNYAGAIADYKKAITLDPDFIEAHQQYISTRQREPYLMLSAHTEKTTGKATGEQEKAAAASAEKQTQALAGEYEALAKEHPNSAVYAWALRKLYEYTNVSRQEEYCRQALKIDSRFAPGYVCLATIASNRGDLKHAAEYQERVTKLESLRLASGRLILPTDDDTNRLGYSIKRWAEDVRKPKDNLASGARVRGNCR
jgi:tetratricopeptide (TPR) repeat protein